MKKITISIAMLMGLNGFSQMTERKKLVSGTDKWEIEMSIENNTDTMTYFYYGYQNKEYSHIVDRSSVFLTKKNDLIDFANGLKMLSTKQSGANIQLTIGDYSIKLYDFAEEIFIIDKRGKYTYITKKQAVKMADEFILNANLLRK